MDLRASKGRREGQGLVQNAVCVFGRNGKNYKQVTDVR